MALMAVLLFFGAVGRIARYVPLQGIAGFLLVVGIPVIMPENLLAVSEAPLAGGTALAVTALSNPFYGLLAGQAVALFWPGM
jgi:AGZA family xanthine/uracil permease-like MFS transporter